MYLNFCEEEEDIQQDVPTSDYPTAFCTAPTKTYIPRGTNLIPHYCSYQEMSSIIDRLNTKRKFQVSYRLRLVELFFCYVGSDMPTTSLRWINLNASKDILDQSITFGARKRIVPTIEHFHPW
jgi:hypothetical protein